MFFSLLITTASGIALLIFVLIISLIFLGAENVPLFGGGHKSEPNMPSPLEHFLTGRCSGADCPPPCLYASCICLLLIFLFVPMGSLPQFVSTRCDIFIILILLTAAQSLYIRGMKRFSAELYQSLDKNEINLLFKFTMAMIVLGGTFSWYLLNRGVPGNVFSLDTFAAMPLWGVTGLWGKAGLSMFFILLALTLPGRRVHNVNINDGNIPLPEMFDAIRLITCPAMITAIFFPVKLGLSVGLIGLPMYALDFVLFWLDVFLMQIVILPQIRNIYIDLRQYIPERFEPYIAILLGVSGVVFMMLDLYL